MNFCLIICTYQRPESLHRLLKSVKEQSLYPNQILIVDGSEDDNTKFLIQENPFSHLEYFKVPKEHRGLTKQRNFGISNVQNDIGIICFLDDDVVLASNYFKELLDSYIQFPGALGVGGYILKEIEWKKKGSASKNEFEIDGWIRELGSRNIFRKKLGLLSDKPPGYMPEFSNGLSISFLPPSGKIYPVEFFMGGVSSYRKDLFNKISFSPYFEGYGLYEDMDFCLRASKIGQLHVNTAAKLYHHHHESGRPNTFKYGKMVLRNGWYVWRVKYPSPAFKAQIKWHATAFLLTLIRFSNTINTVEKKGALTESMGRVFGWWSLFLNKPHKK